MRLEGPKKKLDPWDQANLLQNQKNEEVHVTTAANQRYVYRQCFFVSSSRPKGKREGVDVFSGIDCA